jgi:MFS family permease
MTTDDSLSSYSVQQPSNEEDPLTKTHPARHDCEEQENEVEPATVTSALSPSEEEPSPPKSFYETITSPTLRPFVIISTSYLLFTITDGAIRMIVLLHAYNKSFSALQVAYMFTLYELAGVVTNLAAGFLGAQWGIRYTLLCGLLLQLLSYGLLFGWNDDWSQQTAIVYVTIAQMFAGIAKDLTKLGGKTVTKLVTPEDKETQLFRLVSLLTGWKNSLKGVGYFLGSAMLQVSYELALCIMMGLVLLALPWAYLGLDHNLGTAKKENATWRSVFKMDNTNLNWLSAARLFLFASRDFWFEVPLPFFLRSPTCEGLGETVCALGDDDICQVGAVCVNDVCTALNSGGGCGGLGMNRVIVGAMLGGYIILYGQVQSCTPQWITGPLQQTPPNKWTEVWWGVINSIPTLVAGCLLQFAPAFENNGVEDAPERNEVVMTILMIVILVTFAFVFAVNSSIHSYLIVAYASMDKVAVSVGFYYMSNAVGRLFGTLGSGLLYTYVGKTDWATTASGHDAVAGLAACFFAGTICSLLAAWITIRIDDNKSGLKCGPCWTIVPVNEDLDDEEQVIVEPQPFPVGVVKEEVNRQEDGVSK